MALALPVVGVDVGLGLLGATIGFERDTPLFQTSFFPDLTQVNLLSPRFSIFPIFGQAAPAFGAAKEACGVMRARINTSMARSAFRLMAQR